jgi:hypothetical protein
MLDMILFELIVRRLYPECFFPGLIFGLHGIAEGGVVCLEEWYG